MDGRLARTRGTGRRHRLRHRRQRRCLLVDRRDAASRRGDRRSVRARVRQLRPPVREHRAERPVQPGRAGPDRAVQLQRPPGVHLPLERSRPEPTRVLRRALDAQGHPGQEIHPTDGRS